MRSRVSEGGFTLIELLATVGIIGIVAAMTVPSTARTLADLRLRGDARAVHNMVSLAKMRSAARFTRERVYVDLSTESFFLQYWDKTASAGAGAWVTEGGATALSSGVDFSFGSLSSPPANTQASLLQAPACRDNVGGTIGNTACVVFNSRGIPIDSTGAPNGNTAFYVTDGETGVYGITVSATPLVRLWWSPASQTSWIHK
jgi:prepilin-type N-terminal cleavage/methylation domain-containing protein